MPCAPSCGRHRSRRGRRCRPPCSTSRSTASWAAAAVTRGSTAALEALGGLGDEAGGGARCAPRRSGRSGRPRRARSSSRRSTSDDAPPMTPAMAETASLARESVMSRSSGSSVRSTPSSVVSVSPESGPPHDDRAAELVEVVGVERLPDGEHDVVGHVDGELDRAHPHLGRSLLHPRTATGASGRCRARRARRSGRSPSTPSIGASSSRRIGWPSSLAPGVSIGGRVAEATGRAALAVPVLAGEAAHREAVAPVGRHVGLDGLLGEAEQGDGVVAGLQRGGHVLGAEEARAAR